MTTEKRLAESLGIAVDLRIERIGTYDVRYAVAGSGPPLVLLHGANFGWGVWYPNIPTLAQRYTIYAIDLPGAGRSTRLDYATLDPLKDFVGVVETWIERLDLRRMSLVGCSIGGWVALRLALTLRERVDKIILENTIGFVDYRSIPDRMIGYYPFAQLIARMFLRPGSKNIEKFLRGIFHERDMPLRKEFVEYFYETMATSHNLLFISRMTALHAVLSLERELPRIKTKTLILWGAEDKIMPLEKNEDHFALIPDALVHIIKGAGHIPSLEMPDAFNALTLEFLGTGIIKSAVSIR